jgi:hypothetical protein
MTFVPVAAQTCPEPDTQVNLTYNITSGYESCYGGYILYTKIIYFCMDDPESEPHKTMECGRGGRWKETDSTPWPNCRNPTESTTELEPTTITESTITQRGSTTIPSTTPRTESTTTIIITTTTAATTQTETEMLDSGKMSFNFLHVFR